MPTGIRRGRGTRRLQWPRTYDVENRLVRDAWSHVTYGYDPSGKRVWRIYDAEYGVPAPEVYFYGLNGKRMATIQRSAWDSGCACYGFGVPSTDVYFGGKMIKSQGQTVVT